MTDRIGEIQSVDRRARRVSVGMPVYNGEKHLERAIDSILAQDFGDFELIISDNASEDRTEAICRQYSDRDDRISYFRSKTNQGAAWNYNFVFSRSRGEFFKWAAHDDECEPTLLSRCVEMFDHAPPSVVLVYPRGVFIDGDGAIIGEDEEVLETRHRMPHRRLARVVRHVSLASAVVGLIRSSALRQTRMIDSFAGSDYVLLAELALLGEIWEIPEPLFRRRIHDRTHRMVYRTRREAALWFDPSQPKPSLLSPRAWPWMEYLRSVYRARLNLLDKCLCFGTVPVVHFWRRFRVIGGRCKRNLRDRLTRGSTTPSITGT